jgi:hypothetical protein
MLISTRITACANGTSATRHRLCIRHEGVYYSQTEVQQDRAVSAERLSETMTDTRSPTFSHFSQVPQQCRSLGICFCESVDDIVLSGAIMHLFMLIK